MFVSETGKIIRGAAIGAALIAIPMAAHAADAAKWKIGVVDPDSFFITQLTDEWADMVAEKSDGAITHQMFASGQLGSDVAMLEGLRQGTLQVWEGAAPTIAPFSPLNDAWGMPYLFDDDDHRYRFWDEHFQAVSDLVAEESGYRLVAVLNGPSRQLNTIKAIETLPDDIQGLKLRVPEMAALVNFWQAAGASPTAMPFTEVYSALETGVIDGQENDLLLTEASGFFEVTGYFAFTDYVAYDAFIVMDEAVYQNLDATLKDAVDTASHEIMIKSREVWGELQDEAFKRQEEKGVVFTNPDLTPLKEVAAKVRETYSQLAPIYELVEQSR